MTNTLQNNDNWESEKVKLEMGVMGSTQFVNETQPLNKNQLNLSSWHGFQEIISKNQFDYNQIDFDTLIEEKAYVIIHFFIKNNQKFSIKIGGKSIESYCLVIDEEGKFIQKTLLENLHMPSKKWFHTKINISNDKALITIKDKTFTCDFPKTGKTKIGFRGSYSDVFIDNIVIKGNGEIFKENFSNKNNNISMIVCIFILLTLIQFIISKKCNYFIVIAVNISILLSLSIFYIYLLLFFIGNYPNIDSIINNIKTQEEDWIGSEIEKISKESMEEINYDFQEKIMFVGSSQTWGAGASSKGKTFPVIFEDLINKSEIVASNDDVLSNNVLGTSTEKKITVINTGISGTNSSQLLEEYINKWIKLKPKAVIINLSHNDRSIPPELFKENIEKFIEINNNNNIKTILLSEANSNEVEIENNLHKILQKISVEQNVLLIDIDSYLKNKSGSGLMWWDVVHPTDYGHKLIAEYILETIIKNTDIIQ